MAGLAGVAEQLALLHVLTDFHGHPGEVEVLALQPSGVLQHHVVRSCCQRRIAAALGAVSAGQAHHAVQRGHHRCALRHPEVPGPEIVVDVRAHRMHLRDREGEAAPERDGDQWRRRRLGASRVGNRRETEKQDERGAMHRRRVHYRTTSMCVRPRRSGGQG